MAAKMAYFHQQSKFGMGAATNGPNNNGMEVSPELHVKMSKKIAQLTKVIYALNTKNDEHEASLQSLKETHEEETQRLLIETKKKLTHFQTQLSQEKDLRRRIKELEGALASQDQHKRNALMEFTDYKKKTEESESDLRAEHSQKILSLSEDLLDVKRNFEFKLNEFEKAKEGLKAEKEQHVRDLEERYRRELDILKRGQKIQENSLSEENNKAKAVLEEEIVKLKSQNDQLNHQKEETTKDYEGKLEKLQAFHERELAALRDGEAKKQNENWLEKELALKAEF
ncbi:hypothetical protein BSL78_08122, partial [Apostichopus japonicus]